MKRHTRRGSVYILVLGVTVMVMTVGVGAALSARSELERQASAADLLGADAAARSALDLAIGLMNNYPTAIPAIPKGTLYFPTQIGDYVASVAFAIPDGTSPWGATGQRYKLTALAERGQVRQYRSIIVEPVISPAAGGPYFRMIPGSYHIEIE